MAKQRRKRGTAGDKGLGHLLTRHAALKQGIGWGHNQRSAVGVILLQAAGANDGIGKAAGLQVGFGLVLPVEDQKEQVEGMEKAGDTQGRHHDDVLNADLLGDIDQVFGAFKIDLVGGGGVKAGTGSGGREQHRAACHGPANAVFIGHIALRQGDFGGQLRASRSGIADECDDRHAATDELLHNF